MGIAPQPNFEGRRVLVLESRRGREMGAIVTAYGGVPTIAPSMREVPLASNTDALAFADQVICGEIDLVILLTGVGARILIDTVAHVRGTHEPLLDALRRAHVAVRGPKPAAVMREMQVPVWVTASEPNTWRELLAAIDAHASALHGDRPNSAAGDPSRTLQGVRVGVQEYGASSADLLAALRARGAQVTAVPVYQWALPDDLGPLQDACRALVAGELDVALFTTSTQLDHLLQVAESLDIAEAVRRAFDRMVVASVGPTTSETLSQHGIRVDLQASHPKMGFLVREAAEHASAILQRKRE